MLQQKVGYTREQAEQELDRRLKEVKAGRLESDHEFVLRRTEGLAPSVESRKKAENPWFSHEKEERTK
jgi:hypothetical protein